MHRWSVTKILAPWFLLLAVTACGTTSQTDGNNDMAGGGIGGTGISVGKITDFGSVWVNGIRFDTTGAQIIKDGVTILAVVTDDKEEPPKYLSRGMIVVVRGEFNLDGQTGTASSIEFRDNLEGPISVGSIDLGNQTFEVLGQTIKVDVNTVFEGTTDLSKLADGDFVEVSGFVNAGGIIQASYIALKSDGHEIELKGIITNLDTVAMTFTIGSQTIIDYSNATFEDMSVATLDNGLFVEVKISAGIVGNILIASEIELEDDYYQVKNNDEFEVEGYVTELLTEGQFRLAGQIVKITAATQFKDGSSADIKVNTKLEVEGTVDAFGVLVADKIKIESVDNSSEDDQDHDQDDDSDHDSTDSLDVSDDDSNADDEGGHDPS